MKRYTIHWIGIYTMVRKEVARTMRVVVQTLVSPVMSAALYIFIFGKIIGTKIDLIAGVPYITFVFPGILTLSVINAAFASSSSALYMARFSRAIDELLIAPFSYVEMIFGFMLGSLMRALMVSILILIVGILFGAVSLINPFMFFVYILAVAGIFSLLGIIVALWANSFEQLSALNTFVITPFTYLGGIFYSIQMLPPLATHITLINPFFYFVDGVRSAMIGVSEANTVVGVCMITGFLVLLGSIVHLFFKRGWGIRV